MVSGIIQCGYCKEKVTRNCYGKHLLSKRHQEQFLKENKRVIEECFIHPHKKTPMTTINRPAIFTINKESCSICFTCKKYYSDKDYGASYGRLEASDHFTKSPDCKANYLASLKKFTVVKKAPVNTKGAVNTKEVEELKERIAELEVDVEESSKDNEIYYKLLSQMLGTGELGAMIERVQEFKEKGLLPFYKNEGGKLNLNDSYPVE